MKLASFTVLLVLIPLSVAASKACSRFVTAQMRANALANVKEYPWVARLQRRAVANAGPWVEMSDDELWAMPTSQELPRDIHTNKEIGCPKCGRGIFPYGNYPWKFDVWKRPWKLKCPNCGEVFPKNDFYAFYQTALDEHGMFRRDLGDRSLLFNAEHPDPKDPLHKLYVDDGYGMLDGKGRRHRIIAYYNSWAQWTCIDRAVRALSRAFTLTNDRRCAHKAAVLLDRIADVYPEMDFMPLHKMGFEHSHGGTGQGRILGCIWETNRHWMAYAYDCIYDGIRGDGELVKFCSVRANKYKLGDKSSIAAICRHIEDHLLLEILKSTRDGRIAGNVGMTHACLAVTAIALDRRGVTEKWLDWLFDPRFPGDCTKHKSPIPWVLVDGIDRDGMGGECGGYGLIWTGRMKMFPELFARYPEYRKHDLLTEFPKLKQCFLVEPRLMCLDTVFPPIGDSGSTGNWGRVGNPRTFAAGYALYRDPRLAALAWRYSQGKLDRLRLSDAAFQIDPDALPKEIARVAKLKPFKLRCDHLGRYGLAYVQTEKPKGGRALWIHYGCRKGHSHSDCLNIGLYAKNVDMLPDLGYPEYTGPWPKRVAWTSHTVSHNTVMVNDTRSAYSPGGKINLFAVQPPLRIMDVSSKAAYKGVDAYRRTVALVDVSTTDSYVFDVFRVRGGKNHRLSYHALGHETTVTGLSLVKQARGTLAGEDVKSGEFYDGKKGWGYKGSGMMYLYDVRRSAGPVDSYFTVDWKINDLRKRVAKGQPWPHLRLHSLSASDQVALAMGDPPQNKRGNPRRLAYLVQSRLGANVQSQFITVLEPYAGRPFIRTVRKLRVRHDAGAHSVAAVAVGLENGMTDIVISCEGPTRVKVEGGIEFEGRFALVRLAAGGGIKLMRMANARRLEAKGVELTSPIAAYRGRVVNVDSSNPADNRVFLDPPLPRDKAFIGRPIHFKNDLPLDTTYDIKAVGEGYISTGDITIVAGFKDPKNFSAGFRYLVNPGDEYVVPCFVGLDR